MNPSVVKSFSLFLCVLACCGCLQTGHKSTADIAKGDKIKPALSTVDAKLLGYWDNFNFKDVVALNNPNIGEQTFVDFIADFPKVSGPVRTEAITKMLSRAKRYPFAFDYFSRQYEHYLYDPNSPMRNDAYYEPVLHFLLDSVELSDTERVRTMARLTLEKRNKVATKAADFGFELPDRKNSRLYEVSSSPTLLIFYEPDCPNCQNTLAALRGNSGIRELVRRGLLNILTVYAGTNFQLWRDYQVQIPVDWINGFDRENRIQFENLYDLKASPTIYLLDKDKKVLIKDGGLQDVAHVLTKQILL